MKVFGRSSQRLSGHDTRNAENDQNVVCVWSKGRRCFRETKRSRGVMERTNDQTGHGMPKGGVGRGGGTPLPPP